MATAAAVASKSFLGHCVGLSSPYLCLKGPALTRDRPCRVPPPGNPQLAAKTIYLS